MEIGSFYENMDILYSVEMRSVDWETFTWHHFQMQIAIKKIQ